MTPVLVVRDLRVQYAPDAPAVVDGIDLRLRRGEALAIVGESGAGKSTLARALVGLVQPPQAEGSVEVGGVELLGASGDVLREQRWDHVAIAMQGAPFNPVSTIGAQIAEPMVARRRGTGAEIVARAREVVKEVNLDPTVLDRHPHELSGGERRRASIAMALVLEPDVLILDEPTAGLDAASQAELIAQLLALRERADLALLVVTHDLATAARVSDRTMVMYGGRCMEIGPTRPVLTDPRHPYSWALVNAYPVITTTKDLRPIRGRSPDGREVIGGCPFHPRCNQAVAMCSTEVIRLQRVEDRDVACHLGGLTTVLAAERVSRRFGSGARSVQALDGASLLVRPGEAVGLVGPSGSGKTTFARILSGDLAPDSGRVLLDGEMLPTGARGPRAVQLVQQDPSDALSPRLTVQQLVGEPLLGDAGSPAQHRSAVERALAAVGLPSSGDFTAARSHELSGGQLQRIAVARALVVEPRVIVADEPTAMLDASEQARLLVQLRSAQVEYGLALVLVSHDLAIVRKVTDRIVVLVEGRVVEEGPSSVVAVRPRSTSARALLDAAARLEFRSPDRRDEMTKGERGEPT